jgi:hypothetical protein
MRNGNVKLPKKSTKNLSFPFKNHVSSIHAQECNTRGGIHISYHTAYTLIMAPKSHSKSEFKHGGGPKELP